MALWPARADDIDGVVALYGGRTSTHEPGLVLRVWPISAPMSLSAERRTQGIVLLRFGRPVLPVLPLFLAAMKASQGGGDRPCPKYLSDSVLRATRYPWNVGIGEQMAMNDQLSQPGRYCYSLWSTDPLGRPSDRPATV